MLFPQGPVFMFPKKLRKKSQINEFSQLCSEITPSQVKHFQIQFLPAYDLGLLETQCQMVGI